MIQVLMTICCTWSEVKAS